MQKNLERYFRRMDPVKTPDGMIEGVFVRIAGERRRLALLRHLPALALGLCLSAAATVFAVRTAVADAVQSGLTGFLMLLVTDHGAVASSWQAYAMTIVDALPAAPIAVAFAAAFGFFALLRRLDDEVAPRRLKTH